MQEAALERVREVCTALPEVVERPSHGMPTFFVQGKRAFAMFTHNHHGDGRLALWLAAAPGVQEALAAEAPSWYFKPPYVGVRGWIGVRLDRDVEDAEMAELLREAYCAAAPAKLAARCGPVVDAESM